MNQPFFGFCPECGSSGECREGCPEAPVKESLTTEQPDPDAMVVDNHCPECGEFEAECLCDEPECEEHEPISTPHCAICLMQERDALRVDLDRSKARTDRAINEIRALRERVKELVDACEALKSDLLDRADTDGDGLKVVDVSHSKWERFKAALAAMQEGKS